MGHKVCDICDSDEYDVLAQCSDRLYSRLTETFSLVRCRSCGFVYVNPIPDHETLQAHYPEEYGNYINPVSPLEVKERFTRWLQHGYMVQRLRYPSRDTLSLLFARALALLLGDKYRHMPPFVRGGRLLDVGCATGRQMLFFRELGWDVYGAEPNVYAANLAKSAGLRNVFVGTLEQAHYPDNFFGCVWFHHVLEHLPNPLQTLEETNRILRIPGCVCIVLPSIDSWLFRHFGT